MPYALVTGRLPYLSGNLEHEIEIMTETNTAATPNTPASCGCAGAAKAQPTAAPVAQPETQPAVAAPAPAAPKAAKRNARKR